MKTYPITVPAGFAPRPHDDEFVLGLNNGEGTIYLTNADNARVGWVSRNHKIEGHFVGQVDGDDVRVLDEYTTAATATHAAKARFAAQKNEPAKKAAPKFASNLTFPLAGGQYHGLKTESDGICGGDTLVLAPEPTNRHDKNAIAVLYNGTRIGYVPAALTADVRKYQPATRNCWRAEVQCYDGKTNMTISLIAVRQLDAPRILSTTPNQEEITMSILDKTIAANKAAATTAGFMEAGRIANNQVAKLASKKLPLMVRAYADTPGGKLVIANVATMAAQHFRPGDAKLAKLTQAMSVQAYQELLGTLDIESFLEDLLSSPQIKSALKKLEADAE